MSAESDLLLHCGDNLLHSADFGDLDRELLTDDLFEGVTVPDFNFEASDLFKYDDDKFLSWNGHTTTHKEEEKQNFVCCDSDENFDTTRRMHRLSLDNSTDKAPPVSTFLQFSTPKSEPIQIESSSPVLLGYPAPNTTTYSVSYSPPTIVAPNGNSQLHVSLPLVSSLPTTSSAEILSAGEKLLLDEARDVPSSVKFSRVASAIDFGAFVSKADATGDSLSPLPTYLGRPNLMQRSFSSHSLDQLRTTHGYSETFPSQYSPVYSAVPEVPKTETRVQSQMSDLHGVNLRSNFKPMRRVYSTGDIQSMNGMHMNHGSGSPLTSEISPIDEPSFKIGRYSAEERKQRIYRYRKKRNERNFNKKIKYACRKTLADSRPRVRGRFARNEETDISAKSHHDEDEEDEVDVAHEDEEDFLVNRSTPSFVGGMISMAPYSMNNGYPFLGYSS